MASEVVSICIPVYNREKFLDECLSSIIIQTYKCIEILIVDDFSDDTSRSIILKYANTDNRIKYFFFDNHVGVSTVRNKLLDMSSGKYLMFIDSDDFYASKASIEVAINEMNKQHLDLLCYSCNCLNENHEFFINDYFVFENKTVVTDNVFNTLLDFSKRLYTTSACNKVFLKEIIDKYNVSFPPDISIGEDYIFLMEYCTHIDRIGCISDCLYTIRIHKSLSSCNNNKFKMLNHLNQILYLYECLPLHTDLVISNLLFTSLLIRAYLSFNPKTLIKTWHLFDSRLTNEQFAVLRKNIINAKLSDTEIKFGKTIYNKKYRIVYLLNLYYLKKQFKNERV